MKNKRIGLALVLFLSMLMTAFAAGKPTSDDYLTDAVSSRLAADSLVKGGNIKVEVKGGVVTLDGKVSEAKQKTKAEHLAKGIKGVKSVVNNLKIEKP
ncbi:MAG TPA: BON domain-containing protein [Bryobacteraceae bacterium]|nr:BON domain-containing protein [Bryobacteraceae bacterium]